MVENCKKEIHDRDNKNVKQVFPKRSEKFVLTAFEKHQQQRALRMLF